MSMKSFFNAVAFVLALFALAWISRAVFRADPAFFVSKVLLLAPLGISAFLLIRLSRRAAKSA